MFGDFDDFGGVSWQEPDYLLSYLVSTLVNLGGAPLGVTLLVNGSVLTGTLMSEREYLDILSEMLQAQVTQALGDLSKEEQDLAKSAFDLRDMIEDMYPDMDSVDDDEDEMDEGPLPILHIHLKDPAVISPQPTVSFAEGVFPVMRIRLANVDGWMLGTSIPGMSFNGDNGEIRH